MPTDIPTRATPAKLLNAGKGHGHPMASAKVVVGNIKTNIAKNARMNASVEKFSGGVSAEEMREGFEKLFTTSPERAAKVILKGVKKNQRRILIGSDARVLDGMQRALPALYQKIVAQSLALSSR